MWQMMALVALDVARERAREAQRQADVWRLVHEGDDQFEPSAPQGNLLRTVAARPVRWFGDATHAVSHAACTAATRIEGRTA